MFDKRCLNAFLESEHLSRVSPNLIFNAGESPNLGYATGMAEPFLWPESRIKNQDDLAGFGLDT
jgi:hypothetical protein